MLGRMRFLKKSVNVHFTTHTDEKNTNQNSQRGNVTKVLLETLLAIDSRIFALYILICDVDSLCFKCYKTLTF